MHRTFQSPLLPARYTSPGSLIVSSGFPIDNPEASINLNLSLNGFTAAFDAIRPF